MLRFSIYTTTSAFIQKVMRVNALNRVLLAVISRACMPSRYEETGLRVRSFI